MLTYVVIAFIIMMAIGPLMFFAPSKRQKEFADMREHAALSGAYVEFRKLPDSVPAYATAMRERDGTLIFYGRRMLPSGYDSRQSAVWYVDEGQWRSTDRKTGIPVVLKTLPATVLIAVQEPGCFGFYWRETTEADARAICDTLQTWFDQPVI